MIINYLAIILGTALNIVLARIWYGLFFKDLWRSMTNRTTDEKPTKLQMIIAVIFGLIMSLGTNVIVKTFNITNIISGLQVGSIIGLLFVAPIILGEWIWDKKSLTLVMLNAGFYVVYLLTLFSIFVVL